MTKYLLILFISILATLLIAPETDKIGGYIEKIKVYITEEEPLPAPEPIKLLKPEPEPEFGPYEIKNIIPKKFLAYHEVVARLEEWNKEAEEITDMGTYGKTSRGTSTTFLRIGTEGKPKILIHAAIHGNERLSTAAVLGIMGKILHDYKRIKYVTWLVENRDIYFVPVFSPDSYLDGRYVEGVDPNRDFPYPGRDRDYPCSPVRLIKEFHLKHGFRGVISGHTYGRDFFWPGFCTPEDERFISGLAKEMAKLARYDPSIISGRPHGYETDWYYWTGAVAILTEFGYGHDQPIISIKPETERTYNAFLYFIERAPEHETQPPGDDYRYKTTGWVRDGEA